MTARGEEGVPMSEDEIVLRGRCAPLCTAPITVEGGRILLATIDSLRAALSESAAREEGLRKALEEVIAVTGSSTLQAKIARSALEGAGEGFEEGHRRECPTQNGVGFDCRGHSRWNPRGEAMQVHDPKFADRTCREVYDAEAERKMRAYNLVCDECGAPMGCDCWKKVPAAPGADNPRREEAGDACTPESPSSAGTDSPDGFPRVPCECGRVAMPGRTYKVHSRDGCFPTIEMWTEHLRNEAMRNTGSPAYFVPSQEADAGGSQTPGTGSPPSPEAEALAAAVRQYEADMTIYISDGGGINQRRMEESRNLVLEAALSAYRGRGGRAK